MRVVRAVWAVGVRVRRQAASLGGPWLCCLGLSVLALGGCGLSEALIAIVTVGTTAGSVAVIHRTPPDAAYSIATGRDCSAVRLDDGKSYCRPVDPPPDAPTFCTRSLGSVNCWADPASLPGHPTPVADAPAMTAEQEAYRVRRWPWW